jgi:hypothetical protein
LPARVTLVLSPARTRERERLYAIVMFLSETPGFAPSCLRDELKGE